METVDDPNKVLCAFYNENKEGFQNSNKEKNLNSVKTVNDPNLSHNLFFEYFTRFSECLS